MALPESTLDTGTQLEDRDTIIAEFYRYRSDLNRSLDKFEEAEIARKHEKKLSVLTWISASKKMQLLHKKFQNMRICPDTGRWLFRRYREVVDWIKEDQPPESAMWLHASTGYGNNIDEPAR